MCGFIFLEQANGYRISMRKFEAALNRQGWRGPDSQHVHFVSDERFLLGHNRLSIIDPISRSDQPMVSHDGRFVIVYNGEIYNHLELRVLLRLTCITNSDTETILEAYSKVGDNLFSLLDGMFALVILNLETGQWVAARDSFGIKPLYIGRDIHGLTVLGSEASTVASLLSATPCSLAINEWRVIRRPLPGKSFFQGVDEILPGSMIRQNGTSTTFWKFASSNESYDQDVFESLLRNSVSRHELSDVQNVSLLSGGLDSAVITALSSVTRSYCVGLHSNNEFQGAIDTAHTLGRELHAVSITAESLRNSWTELTLLRGEPLSLPNEGLIYTLCKSMKPLEKVVLTGEGADELLFGYDGIYRWALNYSWSGVVDFLKRYGYSDTSFATDRLIQYIENLRLGKSTIEFVEDFFYCVHLPGLLRRMDFASMAASKEARVPFVSKDLVKYMYRRPAEIKINEVESKLPLRVFAEKLGLHGALSRNKIGFSAQININRPRFLEYGEFQRTVLETLEW